MAGVGLASTYVNIILVSFMNGFNSTLNTFLPQALGFGDYHMCGVYLNRARIIMTAVFIPLGVFLLFTEQVFVTMGFDPVAARLGQTYINLTLPGMYFAAMTDINRKFLQTMGYQKGPMFIQITVTICHIVITYLLIDMVGLGITGIGIATTLSNFSSFIIHSYYTTKFTNERLRKEAWFLPIGDRTRECFDIGGLKDYFKLGLSSIGMTSLEWWSYELMMVFAARLSVGESATQIIILNASSLTFMFPLGFNIAGSVFVGKSIGSQELPKAKVYQRYIQCMGIIVASFITIVVFLLSS